MNLRFDQLSEEQQMNIGNGSVNRGGGSRTARTGFGTGGFTAPKVAKIDFPCYERSGDLTSWIHRVEQFFEFHSTYEEEKLPLAAYHLDGDAQLWYQLFKEGITHEVTWEGLKKGLHARYRPTVFEDFFGD